MLYCNFSFWQQSKIINFISQLIKKDRSLKDTFNLNKYRSQRLSEQKSQLKKWLYNAKKTFVRKVFLETREFSQALQ